LCCELERWTFNICERQNTIVSAFDLRSPRISAYEINEWIYAQMCLNDKKVSMVQIDGPKRHVFIKFRDNDRMQDVFHSTGGQVEYRHTNGEISIVQINTAGMGMRRTIIANVPPEVSDGALRTVLSRYGEVKDVKAETRSRLYRYSVANGIRIAVITLAKHIPSHITVTDNRVLVSYDGQPKTCYGCNDMGHLYQACPLRRRVQETAPTSTPTTWEDITAQGKGKTMHISED
jgi:hypothetical protein